MRPRLHIFVPENDMALSAGIANYTPPPVGWKMHLAGEALPIAYASDGDLLLTNGFNASRFQEIRRLLHCDIAEASRSDILSGNYDVMPWGWSRYTRRLLADSGVPQERLPSDEFLDTIRELSHRRTAIEVNSHIRVNFPHLHIPPEAVEISSPEQLKSFLECGSTGVLKQPWSGSSRGVMFIGNSTKNALNFGEGSIRRQGSVMWETALPGLRDFATLWYCSEGKARFEGYSMSITDGAGRYLGNIVESQEVLKSRICGSDIAPELLQSYTDGVGHAIEGVIAPGYSGPVGVDMLIYRDCDGGASIAPCLEANIRFTMGFVAEGLSAKSDGEIRGTLRVERYDSPLLHLPSTVILSQPGEYLYCVTEENVLF